MNKSTEPRIIDNGARVSSIAFSPDGRRLASGGDNQITIWNTETGQQAQMLPDSAGSAVFGIRGDFLYSAGDRAIRIWYLKSGRVLSTLLGHSGTVTSLAIGVDGKLLASASDDGAVKVWQIRP